jgi:protoporphyrin/coproporphyrin ferrochelatase
MSQTVNSPAPTAIVLLNLGGPQSLPEVAPYLRRMFLDRELIPLPFQKTLGGFIASRRAPKVAKKYAEIGGGSPILKWTEIQAAGMVTHLNARAPERGPFKSYIAFRYAEPLTTTALRQMQADGVRRAIAFTQYPQWSCSTTGASLNELWRDAAKLGLRDAFEWTLIDRWHTHPSFIESMADAVRRGLAQFDPADRADALILFSAHSLPLSVIDRGDAYPQEVSASVEAIMRALGFSHEFMLAYQSDIGPIKWLGPNTEVVLRNLGAKKRRNVLIVPVAFTSDHIETLHEIDIEFAEVAHESGIANFKRAPALNDSPIFQRALADIVLDHIASGLPHSSQYRLRCAGCENPMCRTVLRVEG